MTKEQLAEAKLKLDERERARIQAELFGVPVNPKTMAFAKTGKRVSYEPANDHGIVCDSDNGAFDANSYGPANLSFQGGESGGAGAEGTW